MPPPGEQRYLHIESLFSFQAEWELIEAMLPDMLRVALSMKAGTIMPSTILRRLAIHSRKPPPYFGPGNVQGEWAGGPERPSAATIRSTTTPRTISRRTLRNRARAVKAASRL